MKTTDMETIYELGHKMIEVGSGVFLRRVNENTNKKIGIFDFLIEIIYLLFFSFLSFFPLFFFFLFFSSFLFFLFSFLIINRLFQTPKLWQEMLFILIKLLVKSQNWEG